MSYTHLTMFERSQLEIYRGLGWSLRQIGRAIHRHPSTIGREIQRNQTQDQAAYCSQTSHLSYRQRRLACRLRGKWKPEIQEMIEAKLQLTWSPEQIVGRLFSGRLSTKTIYNWLYHGFLEKVTLQVLRQKGKRQLPKETRGRFNVGTSIHQRPKEVRSRDTFGHWELDTVVSGRGDSKGCFGTFVERKTRFYIAVKMRNRTAEAMETAIRSQWDRYKKGTFRTDTVDRGKEFSCCSKLEQTLAFPFTSQILIFAGSGAAMKMRMDYFGNFSRKRRISH